MWDKRAEYLDNEADSVKMVLDQGFGDTKLVDVRLLGIYVPAAGAVDCKMFISDWFARFERDKSPRWNFIVTTTQIGRFEFVAVVTDLSISSNLNAELAKYINENHWK